MLDMALLLVKNSVCNAAGFRDAASGQMTLSGGCEPGKRNTSADHCNPLYNLPGDYPEPTQIPEGSALGGHESRWPSTQQPCLISSLPSSWHPTLPQV